MEKNLSWLLLLLNLNVPFSQIYWASKKWASGQYREEDVFLVRVASTKIERQHSFDVWRQIKGQQRNTRSKSGRTSSSGCSSNSNCSSFMSFNLKLPSQTKALRTFEQKPALSRPSFNKRLMLLKLQLGRPSKQESQTGASWRRRQLIQRVSRRLMHTIELSIRRH